jgi:hypothetical protein
MSSVPAIDLTAAKLIRAVRADLSKANLTDATLRCDLSYASLSHAELNGINLSGANLTNASLNGADLSAANLSHAKLAGVHLGEATILADVDLSEAMGLESVQHKGFSSIGLDTLYKSQGRIPTVFLRSVGVPEEVIEWLIPLLRNRTG